MPTVNAYRNGELLLANLIGYAPEEIEDCLISYLTDAGELDSRILNFRGLENTMTDVLLYKTVVS